MDVEEAESLCDPGAGGGFLPNSLGQMHFHFIIVLWCQFCTQGFLLKNPHNQEFLGPWLNIEIHCVGKAALI